MHSLCRIVRYSSEIYGDAGADLGGLLLFSGRLSRFCGDARAVPVKSHAHYHFLSLAKSVEGVSVRVQAMAKRRSLTLLDFCLEKKRKASSGELAK